MRRLGLAAIVLSLGCGLDETGLLDILDGGTTDVVSDVAKDVIEEPFVCADAGSVSCTDAAGTPALFSPDAGAPCPAGFDTHDLVLATPQSAACTCQCTDGGAPSCDTSGSNYHYGFGGANCTTAGSNSLSGTCTTLNQTTYATETLEIDPPTFSGGCTGGVGVPPLTTTTTARLCTPECASDERVCNAQGALHACVSFAGKVASCPSNYGVGPFYIGTSPTAACETCSCTPKGDCAGSTAHLYTDTGCTQGDQSLPMDGVCHALSGAQINAFRSTNIQPTVNYQCTTSGGTASIAYAAGTDVSVCCP